jgi:hypothetical protein
MFYPLTRALLLDEIVCPANLLELYLKYGTEKGTMKPHETVLPTWSR